MSGHVPSGYRKARGRDGLTDRERQVLRRLARGETGAEIGTALGLSKQRVQQVKAMLEAEGWIARVGGRVYLSPGAVALVGARPRGQG